VQDEVVVTPIWARVQGEPLNVPAAPAVEVASRVKVTVPAGKDFVPLAVSETVAVQVLSWLSARGVVHTTEVLVERTALKVTVTLFCPPPSTPVEQGFVVELQVPIAGDEAQVANDDVPSAVAIKEADGVPEMLRLHAPTTVTDDVPSPVAPVQAPLPVVG
jgi:hypothetical protein